jgi:uncharacterized protein
MKPLYIAATLQDCGKTSVTLGMLQCLIELGYRVGYTKPVGQRYVKYCGENLDEDAVVFCEALGLNIKNPKDMSPIAIERNFTRKFIENPDVRPLENKILKSFSRIKAEYDPVLVEGTGHAGVGSCFGLSNARVAQLTDARVIMIAPGGIGKPIDEIALNLSLFKEKNVEVLGVVLNKVLPEKYEQICHFASKGFKNIGTRLLGAIPYSRALQIYTLGQIVEEFNYEVLSGSDHLTNDITNIVVAAMEPQNALHYIKENSLIITPCDRIDNILLSLTLCHLRDYEERFSSGGIILTGGFKPDKPIMELIKSSTVPVLWTSQDTYTVSSRMKDLLFKIRASDAKKISLTRDLVKEHIKLENILEQLEQ